MMDEYTPHRTTQRSFSFLFQPGVTNLRIDTFPSASYPKLQRWFAHMRSRPEVMTVSQPLWRHRLFNQGYVAGNPDYDAGLDLRRHH
ncbi:hypothetical protein COOONC_18638 [Cooperia oncophora]